MEIKFDKIKAELKDDKQNFQPIIEPETQQYPTISKSKSSTSQFVKICSVVFMKEQCMYLFTYLHMTNLNTSSFT